METLSARRSTPILNFSHFAPLGVFLGAYALAFLYAQAPMMGDDIDYYGFALHRHIHHAAFPPDSGFHFLRWPVWGLIWLYQWVGGLGWSSYLFVPFFCVALGCAIIFQIGKTMENNFVGLLAAIIFFFHPLIDTLLARPMPDVVEGIIGALGFTLFWFCFKKQDSVQPLLTNWKAGSLLGLLIFITWANRPTGLVWVLAVWILSFTRFQLFWRMWIWAGLIFTCLFVIEGVIYHALFNDFWHGIHANLKATGRKGTEAVALWFLPFRFLDSLISGSILRPIYFILALIGAFILWSRQGDKSDRWLVGWGIFLYLGVACAVQSLWPLRPLVRDAERFIGIIAYPMSLWVAMAVIHLIRRWNQKFSSHPHLQKSSWVALLIVFGLLFAVSERKKWNPDYLPQLQHWLKKIPAGETVRSHGDFYEVAFLANPKTAMQLKWSLFERNEIHKNPKIIAPEQSEGAQYLLLHRPRLMVTLRKRLESEEFKNVSEMSSDLFGIHSLWKLTQIASREATPEFFYYEWKSDRIPIVYPLLSYWNEISWKTQPERPFFALSKRWLTKKIGTGFLGANEEGQLIFERQTDGILWHLTEPVRLPEKVKGQIFDLRVKTISRTIEPFTIYVTFLDEMNREIETQNIRLFASPVGFYDFSGVKVPPVAAKAQVTFFVMSDAVQFVVQDMVLRNPLEL